MQEICGDKLDKVREECGIFGVKLHTEEAAGITYNALCALQHRGQEGAGIAVLRGGTILYHKNTGLVSEVFNSVVLSRLPLAKAGIGHVRYSTTGANSKQNTQPMVTEYLTGRLATAHNGNIVNAREIKEKLVSHGCAFSATNVSEVVSSLIAYETLGTDAIEDAVASSRALSRWLFSPASTSSSPSGMAGVSGPSAWERMRTAGRGRRKAALWTALALSLFGMSALGRW